MVQFDRMNVDEREPFNHYVVNQQNKALRARLAQQTRQIDRLRQAVREAERGQRSAISTISCVERHWKQLEVDARVIVGAADQQHPELHGINGGTLIEQLTLQGPDRLLLTDVNKLTASLDVDPLEDIIRFEDEGADWFQDNEINLEQNQAAQIDASIQQRCALLHTLLQRIAAYVGDQSQHSGQNHRNGVALHNGPIQISQVTEKYQALQAEVHLYRDGLAVARQCQAKLYRALIRVVRENHRLHRAGDWGNSVAELKPSEPVVKSEEQSQEDRADLDKHSNGTCNHDDQAESPEAEHQVGHKRPRCEAADEESVKAAQIHSETLEQLQTLQQIAEKRFEEIERLRSDKAALQRRITVLCESPPQTSLSQVEESPALREALREKDQVLGHLADLQHRFAELEGELKTAKGKVVLTARSKQEAVEEERSYYSARLDALRQENQTLMGLVREVEPELLAKKELVRQADELRVICKEQRLELRGLKEISRRQGEQVTEVRGQWQVLQERVTGLDEEVDRLREGDVQSKGAEESSRQLKEVQEENQRLAAFQTNLFQEAESLTIAYDELSQSAERMKAQLEEKEKRNNRLQDEVLRARAQEKVQADKTGEIEKKARAWEGMGRQMEETLKALTIQVPQLQERCEKDAVTLKELRDKLVDEQRSLHSIRSERTLDLQRLEEARRAAQTMVARSETLTKELEKADAERSQASEDAITLRKRLERTTAQVGHSVTATCRDDVLKMITCKVCNVRIKDTMIQKCHHLFCRECINENLKTRHRKCPACGRAFGHDDVRHFFWTN